MERPPTTSHASGEGRPLLGLPPPQVQARYLVHDLMSSGMTDIEDTPEGTDTESVLDLQEALNNLRLSSTMHSSSTNVNIPISKQSQEEIKKNIFQHECTPNPKQQQGTKHKAPTMVWSATLQQQSSPKANAPLEHYFHKHDKREVPRVSRPRSKKERIALASEEAYKFKTPIKKLCEERISTPTASDIVWMQEMARKKEMNTELARRKETSTEKEGGKKNEMKMSIDPAWGARMKELEKKKEMNIRHEEDMNFAENQFVDSAIMVSVSMECMSLYVYSSHLPSPFFYIFF